MSDFNYLAEMIQKDLDNSDPYVVSDIAYHHKEWIADSFEKEINKYLDQKQSFLERIFSKKKPKKLTLDQLASLFDMILLYQNMSYFTNRGKFPPDYPFNLEWIEDEPTNEEFNLDNWINMNILALKRICNEKVTDHENNGVIALEAFLSILKPYGHTIEEFYSVWDSHLDE